MKLSTNRAARWGKPIRVVVATIALTAAFTGMTTAVAQAQGYYDQQHSWHRYHDRHWGRPGFVYENPGAYYGGPPPVYLAPPPPSPAIDFVFPLHIR